MPIAMPLSIHLLGDSVLWHVILFHQYGSSKSTQVEAWKCLCKFSVSLLDSCHPQVYKPQLACWHHLRQSESSFYRTHGNAESIESVRRHILKISKGFFCLTSFLVPKSVLVIAWYIKITLKCSRLKIIIIIFIIAWSFCGSEIWVPLNRVVLVWGL